MSETRSNYELAATSPEGRIPIPNLAYRPPRPKRYRPPIGLIGCGGITANHLAAYRDGGYQVVALCDVDPERADKRRAEFYPKATVFTDHRELLARTEIEVVDIALHPEPRAAVIREALEAGKHVLSQKPFVTELDEGERLVALAARQQRVLAVNQNGRWAPYFAFMREAIREGLIGEVAMIDLAINWDHTWTRGTPFEQVHHLLLYDFGIHWFDAVASFLPDRPARLAYAALTPAPGQQLRPPLVGQVILQFDHALASLAFNGHCAHDPGERVTVTGTQGVVRSQGGVCTGGYLRLETSKGYCEPVLDGKWFNDGFLGTMGELLCAVEQGREPHNSARANLCSLELCFAALRSADTGLPQVPGQVRRLEH